MRKNAFASMCLFGTDDDSSISGIWIWRGQDLAFEVSSLNHITVKCNKMDLEEVGRGLGDWMELAQDRDRWRALVSTVMNFGVP